MDSKISKVLSEVGLNPDLQIQYNKDTLWSVFSKLMDFRKSLMSEYNLLINPIKRQVETLEGTQHEKSINLIKKQISDLDKTTKKYIEQFKQVEKNIFYVHDKVQPMQYDYDNYDSEQDFDVD